MMAPVHPAMARVRLMDNDFNQLCRMRHEMISVMESMRKVPRGEVSNDLVNRYQQRCSNLMSYQQRMIEAISAQWNLLGRQFNYTSTDYGTKVVAEYILNREGQVTDLKIIFTSASRPATLLVQDAILSRAPFGLWTKEMVATLGEQQTIRITFFYR